MEIGSGPGIGGEPQQPSANFEASAGEIVSRTISVYIRRIGAYIIMVGLPSIAIGILGLAFFVFLFGADGFGYYPGVTGVDPVSLLLSYLGLLGPTGQVIFFILLIGIINTIILAIINGAGVKYALDNYGNREALLTSGLQRNHLLCAGHCHSRTCQKNCPVNRRHERAVCTKALSPP